MENKIYGLVLLIWTVFNFIWSLHIASSEKKNDIEKIVRGDYSDAPKCYNPNKDPDKIMSGKVGCEFDFSNDEEK